ATGSTTIQPISLQRSLITQQHCPILDPLPSQIKFATGTGECRDLRPKQRSHLPDRGYPIRSTGSPSHEAKNQAGNPLCSSQLRRKRSEEHTSELQSLTNLVC